MYLWYIFEIKLEAHYLFDYKSTIWSVNIEYQIIRKNIIIESIRKNY